MNHLHSMGVLHRDLKLANILLHFPRLEGQESLVTSDYLSQPRLLSQEPFLVKIADLGFSKIQLNIEQDLNTTYCGTPINMAPEVLNREAYNYKVDVWSIGTILYELITGQSPFKEAQNKDQLKKCHMCAIQYPKDLAVSKDCINFINLCLELNPKKRPSWEELLSHRFLQSAEKYTLVYGKNKESNFTQSSKIQQSLDQGSSFSQDGIFTFPSATITNSPIINNTIKNNCLNANFDNLLLTQARLPTCTNSSSSGHTSVQQILLETRNGPNQVRTIVENFKGDPNGGQEGCEDLDHEFSCSDDGGSDVCTPVQLMATDLNAKQGNSQSSLMCPKQVLKPNPFFESEGIKNKMTLSNSPTNNIYPNHNWIDQNQETIQRRLSIQPSLLNAPLMMNNSKQYSVSLDAKINGSSYNHEQEAAINQSIDCEVDTNNLMPQLPSKILTLHSKYDFFPGNQVTHNNNTNQLVHGNNMGQNQYRSSTSALLIGNINSEELEQERLHRLDETNFLHEIKIEDDESSLYNESVYSKIQSQKMVGSESPGTLIFRSTFSANSAKIIGKVFQESLIARQKYHLQQYSQNTQATTPAKTLHQQKSDAADDHLSRMNSNGAVIQNILPRVIQPIAQKKSHFSKHKSQFYKENQKIKNGGSASGKDFAIEPVRD
ncbi:hypothetical protein FGO68_gene15826 [Halteria grandinella]|uniref:Protein kinase domain-containing protein n=1 Tax=Halteria grandinella TaxID=5974 RepID=A0A8J8P0U0_HALGN|nr:hypothetical protein FGO68_gene15826 [Halteria grandinella]